MPKQFDAKQKCELNFHSHFPQPLHVKKTLVSLLPRRWQDFPKLGSFFFFKYRQNLDPQDTFAKVSTGKGCQQKIEVSEFCHP